MLIPLLALLAVGALVIGSGTGASSRRLRTDRTRPAAPPAPLPKPTKPTKPNGETAHAFARRAAKTRKGWHYQATRFNLSGPLVALRNATERATEAPELGDPQALELLWYALALGYDTRSLDPAQQVALMVDFHRALVFALESGWSMHPDAAERVRALAQTAHRARHEGRENRGIGDRFEDRLEAFTLGRGAPSTRQRARQKLWHVAAGIVPEHAWAMGEPPAFDPFPWIRRATLAALVAFATRQGATLEWRPIAASAGKGAAWWLVARFPSGELGWLEKGPSASADRPLKSKALERVDDFAKFMAAAGGPRRP